MLPVSALTPLTSAEQLLLLERIADKWGGVGCSRSFDGTTWRFRSDDGMLYEVTLPGGAHVFREDDGRPFAGYAPDDAYIVRCTSSAPDDFFTVSWDGIYMSWTGENVDLLPERRA